MEARDAVVRVSDLASTKTVDESADTIKVRLLSIGASGVSAFAGLNGASGDRIGLTLENVEFGVAMVTETLAAGSKASPRHWTSLQANAGSASFVGVEGVTVVVDTLTVAVNRAAADTTVVDYAGTGATVLSIATGPAKALALSMEGDRGPLLQASGNLTLDLFGFVQLHGGFAIDKGQGSVTLADLESTRDIDESAAPVAVDMLTLGASHLSAFAGIGGGSADAVGLQLGGVDVGLALMASRSDITRSWTSLKASATSAAGAGKFCE